jgi:DNA-binding transcriptional regulator YiaG
MRLKKRTVNFIATHYNAHPIEDEPMPAKSLSAVDRFVSEKVRARRKEIGMTQQALATRLGVTFQQLQKYENGINRISAGRSSPRSGPGEGSADALTPTLSRKRERETERER